MRAMDEHVIDASTVLAPAEARELCLAAPPCTVGITDGSERGDYVPQHHLLRQLGRPHHVVNLMFQYYPDLDGWPTQGVKWLGFYRNRELNNGDGYFPLVLEDEGRWGRFYIRQIEDVRAHGQEPQLTLTLHADTPADTLVRIAQSLAPFAPMRVRINHECNGTWFYFNQRWSYRQVSDFFIRFHDLLHEHAPGVRTVACWNGPGDTPEKDADDGNSMRGGMTDDQLAPMFRAADIVSFDQYASLHYGWPDPAFDPRKPTQFFAVPFEKWWRLLSEFHELICGVRGGAADVEIHEINEDANAFGDEGQARWLGRFYDRIVQARIPWLTNVTFYQFRDRGGLGLEREDVGDPAVYRELPALGVYRRAIAGDAFAYRATEGRPAPDAAGGPLVWRSAVDASGVRFLFEIPPEAGRARLTLDAGDHVLVRAGTTWRVKPRGERLVDVDVPPAGGTLPVDVFAPPADGRNNRSGAYACSLRAAPVLRVG